MFWYYYGGQLVIRWGVISLILLVILGVAAVILGIFTVSQQERAIIERFGKYHRIAGPGLGFKLPAVDWIIDEIDLRLQQLIIQVESKTKDNVFVRTSTSVQYRVIPEKVYEAEYMLEDESQQIKAYVFDAMRARVPTLTLEDLFGMQEEIAQEIKKRLDDVMEEYGYRIESTLLTQIEPDDKVKASLNEIQAATNLRIAAEQKGEGQRILTVKAAEAEAQSKELQGRGIAAQRKAIIEGFKEAVIDMAAATHESAEEVMNLVLLTQYFDTLHALGVHGVTTVLVPHSPGVLGDLKSQIREALMPLPPVTVLRPNGPDAAAGKST